MATAIGIILADLLLFVFYVCQYRQELGLSVNGSHDTPVMRKKPAKSPATRPPAASPSPPPQFPPGPPAARGRQFIVGP
jgi:hypothetical protein